MSNQASAYSFIEADLSSPRTSFDESSTTTASPSTMTTTSPQVVRAVRMPKTGHSIRDLNHASEEDRIDTGESCAPIGVRINFKMPDEMPHCEESLSPRFRTVHNDQVNLSAKATSIRDWYNPHSTRYVCIGQMPAQDVVAILAQVSCSYQRFHVEVC